MPILNLTLADEEFKKAYVAELFVIDCIEIKLTSNDLDSNTHTPYCSSGFIMIGPDKGAEARLVFPRVAETPYDQSESIRRLLQHRPGKITPEGHFFRLEARDVRGNLWTNPAARVDSDESKETITLTVSCDYLRCELKCPNNEIWTDMVMLEELEFPLNIVDGTKRMVRGRFSPRLFEFGSQGNADELGVSYDSGSARLGTRRFSELYAQPTNPSGQVPNGFEERLLEAVRFVTATMFWPVMMETVNDGIRTLELSKARSAPGGGLVNPPLSPRGQDKDFYNLLGRYYRYASDVAVGDEFTSLSQKLGGLFTLKNVWIDTVALLVSVAVEAVLKENGFKNIGNADPLTIKEVDKVFSAIRATDADASIRARAISSMASMKSSRAIDKLYALVKAGALDDDDKATGKVGDPKKWSGLRNTSAHGSLHVDPKKLQELLDNIFGSITVLYKLVFMLIGYTGRYSDYSRPGWAIQEFDATAYWAAIAKEAEVTQPVGKI